MHHTMQMMHPDMQHHMSYGHPGVVPQHYPGVFALVDQMGDVEQMPVSHHEPSPARGHRRGVKRNPDAPKRPMSPYVTFVKAKWSETYERMGPSAAAKDVMRALGNVWNSMGEDGKEEWKTLSDADKARYAEEMKLFDGPVTVPHDRRKKGAKKRGKKDPNAPKRGASAFLLFANDKRQTLREAHPDKHNVEISKMLGAIWKAADDETKAPYLEAESLARQRYDKEMESYRAQAQQQQAALADEQSLAMQQHQQQLQQHPSALQMPPPPPGMLGGPGGPHMSSY